MFGPKLDKIIPSNFYPLEVVDRGSDSQRQVGKK